MNRAKAAPAAEVTPHGPRYSFFCYAGRQPLMEVLTGPDAEARREQAFTLIQTIEEVLGKTIAAGASGDNDAIVDASTAYLLRFAADAAAALVNSLEVAE